MEHECKECGKLYKRSCDLSRHIKKKHYDQQLYYDKYIKGDNEGICKECGNPTKYANWQQGYNKYCKKPECAKKGRAKNIKSTVLNKYGVTNVNKLKTIRQKISNTNIKKYGNICPAQNEEIQKNIREKNLKKLGVELPFQSKKIQEKSANIREKKYGHKYTYQTPSLLEKIKRTNLEKFGLEYPILHPDIQSKLKKTNIERYGAEYQITSKATRNKIKKTNLRLYGVENAMQRKDVQEKFKQTNLERYGVEYPLQNGDYFKKIQKSAFRIKKYKDTDIWYQGSYELDFLEHYYTKFPDIERGPSIQYQYNNKTKVYHSDFFIPTLNLIVECKNSYLANRNKLKLETKANACLKQGYNWVMIVNKDYTQFDLLID